MDDAKRYNAWLYERARPYLGNLVLDVGAGTGAFTERLLADGRTVVALEPDPNLAASLRERLAGQGGLTIDQAEAAEAPGRPLYTANCFNVLEPGDPRTEAP